MLQWTKLLFLGVIYLKILQRKTNDHFSRLIEKEGHSGTFGPTKSIHTLVYWTLWCSSPRLSKHKWRWFIMLLDKENTNPMFCNTHLWLITILCKVWNYSFNSGKCLFKAGKMFHVNFYLFIYLIFDQGPFDGLDPRSLPDCLVRPCHVLW